MKIILHREDLLFEAREIVSLLKRIKSLNAASKEGVVRRLDRLINGEYVISVSNSIVTYSDNDHYNENIQWLIDFLTASYL